MGMKMSRKNYITPSGLKKLRDEYHHLLHMERPKVVESVAWAAGNGDRSENADYIYGKRRLREIDSRLRFLAHRLEKVELVDPSELERLQDVDRVVFGTMILVMDEDGKTQEYQIVGEDEWDASQGKISWKSPVAQALLGRRVGEEVNVIKPAREETLTILEIKYP